MLQKHMTITVSSHNFEVSKLSPRGRQICMEFVRPLLAWGFRPVRGRQVREITKVYAAANEARSYYRFHINKLGEFLKIVKDTFQTDTVYEIIYLPMYEPAPAQLKLKEGWTVREEQAYYVDYAASDKPVSKLVPLQTGKGKALRVDTPIRTPNGWKLLKDINIGDKVIAADGTATEVLNVSPQGETEVFRVHTGDGRSLVTCGEHLWQAEIFDGEKTTRKVINTSEMLELLVADRLISIPLCQAQRDGTDDMKLPPSGYGEGKAIRSVEYGVIPDDILLLASRQYKIDLLIGLVGLEGHDLSQPFEYRVKCKALADSLIQLIWSLGGIGCYMEVYSSSGQVEYRCTGHLSGFGELVPPKLYISGVEYEGIAETQCLTIEHPSHLFVTKDYVVTHNTAVTMFAAEKRKQRIAAVLKAAYMDKWESDCKKMFDVDPDRVMTVNGEGELMAVLEAASRDQLEADIILISVTTWSRWVKKYEQMGDYTLELGYVCRPGEMFQTLGVGLRIIDEVHQHFHAMFKLDLYTHVPSSISLSATLLTKDPFLSKMYELMFPAADRPKNLALNKYAHSCAVHYNFKKPEHIRTTEFGNNNYSHTALEKCIMKHPPTLAAYTRMILDVLAMSYDENPKNIKKAAVYAASIEMCTHLTEKIAAKYPNLDVRRYVADDPYENVIEADIRVSTIGSSGTAIDIPNLVTVLLTVALSSLQANIQVLGRLREITGEKVEFVFLTADNIPKHAAYHNEKREMLKERAATFREIIYGNQI